MPRHAVVTAAMLSCLSAVAVADCQHRLLAVGPIMMARGTTSSTILRVDFAGIPYQNSEASTTCDGWCTILLTLLAANFSIRPCSISHRVVTGKADSLCHFLHVSSSPTYPSPTHSQPLQSTPTESHSRPGYLHISSSTALWCHLSTIQSDCSNSIRYVGRTHAEHMLG